MRGRIEALLPRVAKPARYMGGELGSVRKTPEEVSVKVALAFPDIYEVGMSNLGLRILYSVLNNEAAIAAERVFAPATDMEQQMRDCGVPLFSLETSSPIRDFDLVGFSLAYEMASTTVLNMLDLASIPVLASDRTDSDPVIIAGGHCATNPEPMADFIDAFVIGDGEEAVLDIIKAYRRASKNRAGRRSRILEALAEVDGVYVPSIPKTKVRGRVVLDLENAHFPDRLIVPFTEAVHDRVALEIMRGCSRGCRFCQAGMITRPVRERSLEKLCRQAQMLLDNTGYEEIALTSLSSADHSNIKGLVRDLIDTHGKDRVGISLPSLRADAECVELAAEIQRVRKSGLTFAPEAGTQRLRDVINKNVTEQDLLDAVDAAVENGWKRIKLYFMIGLPTETDEDLQGIGGLVNRVVDIGRRHRVPLALNITISPFVPKPHTPFQWRGMATPEELERKIALIRSLLRGKNISLSWHDPLCSRVEGAVARGDRSLGKVIYEAWKRGGKFEQDKFNSQRWDESFEAAGVDISRFTDSRLAHDAELSWDFVDMGVSKSFLASEDDKAELGDTTPDCKFGVCSSCGVREALLQSCGGVVKCPPDAPTAQPIQCPARLHGDSTLELTQNILFTFSKGPQVRWLGHLDLMRVFERAVRISKVDVAYSRGFNPRVKMSIASALPLGATADNDLISIQFTVPIEPADAIIRLNNALPDGIKLTSASVIPPPAKAPVITAGEFALEISLPQGQSVDDLNSAVADLMARQTIPWERESGGKRRTIDLREGIEELKIEADESGIRLIIRVKHLGFTVKPTEVVKLLSEEAPGIETLSTCRRNLFSQ